MSEEGREKRIVNTAEDLVFYTDTDQQNYPIFISEEREVWIKRRPRRQVNGRTVYTKPVATFFVKSVERKNIDVSHELVEQAISTMRDVTCGDVTVEKIEIVYEVYDGDSEKLLGEAKAYAIRLTSRPAPGSTPAQVWAIGQEWRKRIAAKVPELSTYTYIKKKTDGADEEVHVVVKLPVATEELRELFNRAVALKLAQSIISDLEEQVKRVEEMIKVKEQELQELRERLQQLQLKLQLERMKLQVV